MVGKGKEAIINYFDKSELDKDRTDNAIADMPNIFFVRQKEQRGFGDAVMYAEQFVDNEPFVVLAGDTIYNTKTGSTAISQLIKVFEKEKSATIGLEQVPKDMVKKYGIIDGKKIEDRLWKITDMIEKPEQANAPSNLAATAQYVLNPDIFEYLRKITPGKNGEYQLTDALKLLCKEKPLLGYEINAERYDIGPSSCGSRRL